MDERLAQCVQADTVNAHKVAIIESVKGLGPAAVSTFLARLPEAARESSQWMFGCGQ